MRDAVRRAEDALVLSPDDKPLIVRGSLYVRRVRGISIQLQLSAMRRLTWAGD